MISFRSISRCSEEAKPALSHPLCKLLLLYRWLPLLRMTTLCLTHSTLLQGLCLTILIQYTSGHGVIRLSQDATKVQVIHMRKLSPWEVIRMWILNLSQWKEANGPIIISLLSLVKIPKKSSLNPLGGFLSQRQRQWVLVMKASI